jgi:hypothetical protein
MKRAAYADSDGYHYAPPKGNGLGIWGLDTLVSWGGGKIYDAIAGGGGDMDKAQRAITAGGAEPGPYTEGQLLTAIRSARFTEVAELRRLVLVKDWLRGIGIEQDDVLLSRAGIFLAHGGQDGKHGAAEQAVATQVSNMIGHAGAAVYPDPSYAPTVYPYDALREQATGWVDALQERYLTPQQEAAYRAGILPTQLPTWAPWAAGAAAILLLRR